MNYELHYVGSQYNWLFILFILSVLQWVVTLTIVINNLGNKESTLVSGKNKVTLHDANSFKKEHLDYSRYVSFLSDNFYWFWNIFPIIFFIHFFYIESSWASWMRSFFILDVSDNIKNLYASFFHSDASFYVDVAILALITVPAVAFGYFGQDKKHKKMIASKSELYWWSSELNEYVYLLRKAFLVLNLILVGFLTYIITKISIFVVLILNFSQLNVFPFHMDGYGGLHAIMEITSILISMYLLRASMGVIGLDDHKGQGLSHLIGDLLNIIYLPLGVALFSIVFYKVKNHLSAADDKFEISSYLSGAKFQAHIESFINSKDKASALNEFNDYYSILTYSSFPIDVTLFYNSAFTVVMPISIWFLINNYKDKINA